MKRRKNLFPILTLLGMTATLPLSAQQDRPEASPEASTAAGQQQEMSQPGSRSTSQTSGLTLTGEVIAMDQQAIRVRTETGVENVVITNRTDNQATDLQTGDQVAVDFTRSSQGVLIATQIRRATSIGENTELDYAGQSAGQPAGQPMTGSQVMGHAGQSGTTASGTASDTSGSVGSAAGSASGSMGLTDTTGTTGTTGAMAEDAEDNPGALGQSTATLQDPSTGSASATQGSQALDQTGSQSGSTYGTGSTTGSTTGSMAGSTGSTTGSTTDSTTGFTSGQATATAETESGMATETTSQYSDTTSGTLPDTGSNLPLTGLAGLLALALAFVLRAQR